MASNNLHAVLSEYQTLRAEIQRRSNNQMFCVTASLLSVGTIIGIAAHDCNNLGLLMVIPWVLAVFGIIWLDNNSRIFELGKYIREEIEKKKMDAIFESSNIMWIGWEHHHHLAGKRKKYWASLSFQ